MYTQCHFQGLFIEDIFINHFQFFPKQKEKSYMHQCSFISHKYTNVSASGLFSRLEITMQSHSCFTSSHFKSNVNY